MKKFKLPILMLMAVGMIASFNSCRKGEEDPRITFRSRDTRVTGKWSLKEYTYESTENIERKSKLTERFENVTLSSTDIDVVNTENISLSGGVLSRDVDYRKTDVYNDGTATSTSYRGSKKITERFTIDKLILKINEDFTFGIEYSYKQTSGETCDQEVIGGTWFTDPDVCDTTALSGDYLRTAEVENAGFWKWDDGEADRVEIDFEPARVKTTDETYTESGYNLQIDVAGSPIETVMKGYITRLTNKEMQFKRTIDLQQDWLTTETMEGLDNVIVESQRKSTTTGSVTEIWEKLEETE